MAFDPNARATEDSGIFGLPFSVEDSKLVLIPVPWEATTSYGSGTSEAPRAILEASHQVDLFDLETGKAYEAGYAMLPINEDLHKKSIRAKDLANQVRDLEDANSNSSKKIEEFKNRVNEMSHETNEWVYRTTSDLLAKGKLVGLLGGDHSTPFGAIRAFSEKFKGDFGVLHIDAHHDLRKGYEGFTYSHASIFYNVMEAPWAPKTLVQVGIRDFCEDEHIYAREKNVKVYYDLDVQKRKANGENWSEICREIISSLPHNIYVSFDIDGLAPSFCPNTGTPVPGGLDFSEALILFSEINAAKKCLVGFDLNEVAPSAEGSEWDANVGARVLYKLCGWTVRTNSTL